MATVTKGRTFTSGETVTPTKLNDLVDLATVTNIQAADLASNAVTTAKIADANVTTAKIADGAVTNAKLGNDIVLVPAGAVMPFARSTKPTGWLIADGSVVPNGSGTVQSVTADFSALYAAVGTSFGAAGTLPDLRGIFVRGSGSQTISGITYNKTFAAKEGDAMQGHVHLASTRAVAINNGNNFTGIPLGNADTTTGANTGGPITDGTNGTPRTGSETRPANIALLYCIKF